jgi:putative addiction module killer protein
VKKEQSKWTIKYWCDDNEKSSIEEWFDSLVDELFKSVAKEMKLLELCGNMLKLPHSRSLKKGLFELRERKYGLRIYYTFLPNKTILMLHAGNKKTQDKDIDIARDRLAELGHQEEK